MDVANENGDGDGRERPRYLTGLRRQVRNVVNPFDVPDALFKNNYRLTKALATNLIEELRPYLHPDDNPLAIPNEIKVLAALNFYGTGSYQAPVGANWLHCMGRSTAGACINEVTEALNRREVQRRWIEFPHTAAQRQALTTKHEEKFHMPGILLFVDGSEVEIVKPPEHMNPQSFWTHKHHYALNCMIACDSDLVIRHINASYAGSLNDKFIWHFSSLREKMKELCHNFPGSFWVLGDSGYVDEPWLLMPILNAVEGSAEELFTTCHCKARNCVERCIGVWKARFRCLLKQRALHYLPLKAGKIAKACAALHNMCRMAGMDDDDLDLDEGEEEGLPWVVDEQEGINEALEREVDAELHVANDLDRARLRQVGLTIRQRVVDYLAAKRLAGEIE